MFMLADLLSSNVLLAQDEGAALFGLAFMCCFSIFGLAIFAFWLWMLIDCCTKTFPGDSDKLIWVLVIVLAGGIGAAVYYFVGRPKGVKS